MEGVYFKPNGEFEETFRVFSEQMAKAIALGRLSESHFNNGWPIRVGLKRVMELRATPERVHREKWEKAMREWEASFSSEDQRLAVGGASTRSIKTATAAADNLGVKSSAARRVVSSVSGSSQSAGESSDSTAVARPKPKPKLDLSTHYMQENGEVVDVVVCYCSEPLEWLTVFWKLPFTQEDHSHSKEFGSH